MKQGKGTMWHHQSHAGSGKATAPGIGDVVGGHYVVVEVLAEGGMAVVYRATNTATGKSCALKILHAQLGARPEFVELFAKEAKVTTRIGDNEHIVTVYDAGIDEERGIPFIVMELCEGETLARALERGPLARGLVRTLLEQMAVALEQAHRAGVVHRDLKPSNLFLASGREGLPVLKIMDFGIAKVLEGEAVRTATHIGTPAYNAPEQMGSSTRKLAAKQGITIAPSVSPATDVWALGLIAYEMLTGELHGQYWGVETLSELPMKVAFEDLMPATERAGSRAEFLPDGFDAWFDHALRKDAAERFQSAGEAIGELVALLDVAGDEPAEVPGEDEALQAAATRLYRPAPPPAAPAPRKKAPSERRVPASSAKSSQAKDAAADAAKGPRGTSMVTPSVSDDTDRALPAAAATREPPTPSAMPLVRRTTHESVAPAARRSARKAYLFGGVVLVAAAATVIGFRLQDRTPVQPTVAARPSTEPAAEPTASAGPGACLAAAAGAAISAGCEASCDGGDVRSCARVAEAYANGHGASRDDVRARSAYEKACGVGGLAAEVDAPHWSANAEAAGCPAAACLPEACATLAGYYAEGRGGAPKSERAATALLKRVCTVDTGAGRGVAGCVGLGAQRERAGELEAARRYYEASCEGGVVRGCVALGRTLERSVGDGPSSKDDKRARTLYEKACDAADLEGCTRLGRMVEQGRGGWKADEPAAVALYKRACDGGELLGCVHLAGAYAGAKAGFARDLVRAAELLQKTCEGGEKLGCAALADMTLAGQGGLVRDERRAYDHYKGACEAGTMLGCVGLGRMSLAGLAGLQADASEARDLFGRACRGGEPAGCVALGWLELGSAGTNPSADDATATGRAEAQKLFEGACDDGLADGCTALGELLEAGGRGSEADLARARELYEGACARDGMRACSDLANLTYQGAAGIERDAKKSAELNERACRGGDRVGCQRLGMLFAMGDGVARDLKRAAELDAQACQKPFENPASEARCASLAKLIAAGGSPAPR